MAQYRNVGAAATKEGVFQLEQYGQAVELDEKTANECILDGVSLLPEADFKKLGFTLAELSQFAMPESHAVAPDTFMDKKRAAWLKVHQTREALKNPPAPVEPKKAPAADSNTSV